MKVISKHKILSDRMALLIGSRHDWDWDPRTAERSFRNNQKKQHEKNNNTTRPMGRRNKLRHRETMQ